MARVSKRGPVGRPSRPRRRRGSFLLIFLVLLVVAGAYVGWRAYVVFIKMPLQPIFNPVPTSAPRPGTPLPTPRPPDAPINILLIGIDRREGQASALNDVNIVVHLDPQHEFATMLSIPRDTRVEIPGFGAYKINAAYGLGERYRADAGGGPALVMQTVETFLGMEIDHYAEVDFEGFTRIVNYLGGITVDVPFPLVDNEYPTADFGYSRIYIPAGLQHMDGTTALQYARSRHGDPLSDIGRNRRQQQVLIAMRRQILERNLIDYMLDLEYVRGLIDELAGTMRTSIPLETLRSLAWMAPRINLEEIVAYSLDWQVLYECDGSTDLCVRCYSCLRQIVEEMQMDPITRQLREEGARVEVRNGTLTCNGCARSTYDYLLDRGVNMVTYLQDVNAGSYPETLILDSGDHPFTRSLLAQWLDVSPAEVREVEGTFPSADIVIILGDDYVPPGQ